MNLILATISMVLTASFGAPVLAQDWDMQSESVTAQTSTQQQQQFSVPAPQNSQNGNVESCGWDTSALQIRNPIEAAQTALHQPSDQVGYGYNLIHGDELPGNTTYRTGELDLISHSTDRTGNQAMPTLPICGTHTLAKIEGAVGSNGLPMVGTAMPEQGN